MSKILVIDDSRMLRQAVLAALSEAGHHVLVVDPASLFEVLKQLYEFDPVLIVTDYEMPKCNGETLIRVIREDPKYCNIKLLVLTAHREADLVQRMGRHGVDGFLVKGKDMFQTLVSRVTELLKQPDRNTIDT